MPELPEVETVRIQLRNAIVGKTISGVEVFHSKSVGHDERVEDALVGKTIADIDRVGKLMIFSFVGESDLFLLAHLKMTGQFFVVAHDEVSGGGHSMTESDIKDLPGRHTRLAFYFTNGTALYFNDMRLFGYVRRVNKTQMQQARNHFGPEPIADDFDVEWFVATLTKRSALIKAVLLDQTFVAGLGNIYVDEALWRAKVLPMRRANTLSTEEAAAVAAAANAVLTESIAVNGTTFQHFRDVEGERGNFTQYLQVFGKQGTACSRCGTIIQKTKTAGRGTHYCPGCQF